MARQRKKRRRRNPQGASAEAAIGGAVGSLGGILIGAGLGSALSGRSRQATYTGGVLGSIFGGAAGAGIAAGDRYFDRATVGGGLGGIFGPLGAGLGGCIAADKPDRSDNPSPGAIALGIVGGLAALGSGYAVYRVATGRKVLPTLDGGNGLTPAPVSDEPSEAEAHWGTGLRSSTRALIEGVPVRLLQDEDGRWNFAYSWAIRPEGEGSGPLWDWLRQNNTETKTVLVLTRNDSPADAYRAASDWIASVGNFVDALAPTMESLQPGMITTPTGNFYNQEGGWGLMWMQGEHGGRFGMDRSIEVIDGEDQKNWAYGAWQEPSHWTSGCCYTFEDAAAQLQATRPAIA